MQDQAESSASRHLGDAGACPGRYRWAKQPGTKFGPSKACMNTFVPAGQGPNGPSVNGTPERIFRYVQLLADRHGVDRQALCKVQYRCAPSENPISTVTVELDNSLILG